MPSTFYELLSHTADTGIRVRGKDWPELLRNAARAFYDVLTDWESVSAAEARGTIELEAADREELLVAWLSELLFWFDVRRVLFAEFTFEQLTHTSLRAHLRGEPFDEARHRVKTDIKAVTYHGVRVEDSEAGLVGEVIFDL